jgi:hypothetical protein
MNPPPFALWSIWHQCSELQHWFIYTLGVLCLYAGFCVVSTIARLLSIKHLDIGEPTARRTLVGLRNRCATLRFAVSAEFYLFGVVLFIAFQFVGQFIMGGDVQRRTWQQFVLDSAFAANVFAVFLILHLAQWFISIRLRRYRDVPSRSGQLTT